MLLLFSAASPSTGISASPRAQLAPTLGAAGSYSVLGAAGVTDGPPVNTSTFNGDVGAPTTGIIATQVSAPGVLNPGTEAQALLDAAAAWTFLSTGPQPLGTILSLAGTQTVGPGVYDTGSSGFTGGTLTLDGPGVYIFRGTSSLTDPGGSTVRLINGADPCNVFWQIQTSMSFGAGTTMVGTIITQTASITFGNGTTVEGRAIALGAGQVTLINNTFTNPICIAAGEEEEEDNTVRGLPNTGGAPIQNGDFPWSLAILGGISAIALGFGLRAYRRNQLPK